MGLCLDRKAGEGIEISDGKNRAFIKFDRSVGMEIVAPVAFKIIPLEKGGKSEKKRGFKR